VKAPDPFVLEAFVRELDRQVRFGILAYADIAEAVRGGRPDEERFWYSIQGFLIAAGNVSKLLFPPVTKHAERGAHLRQLLHVEDDSPIAPRVFRNHFEHFDERLENWAVEWARGATRVFVDSNISAPGGLVIDVEPTEVLRHF
jgi:hypothetical protein